MKPTSETGFEQMDTIVNDLLEQVQEMRATLLSAKTSLEALHVDPAELDLEGMLQEMIDSEIDFDREFDPDAQ